MGIFAKKYIAKGEEITFDYGARSRAANSAPYICGAKNCRGKLAAQENDSQPETAPDVSEKMEPVAKKQAGKKQGDIEMADFAEKEKTAKDGAAKADEKPDEQQANASNKRSASAQNGPSLGKSEAVGSPSRKKRRLSGEDARLRIIRTKISKGRSAMQKAKSLSETLSKMRDIPTISQTSLSCYVGEAGKVADSMQAI